MSQKRDYYEVLGVSRKASDTELKKAFRSMARKFHPDKNPDDAEAESRFKEVQEAYAILSNAEERRKYDMFGHERPGGSPWGSGGFQGVNISFDDILEEALTRYSPLCSAVAHANARVVVQTSSCGIW